MSRLSPDRHSPRVIHFWRVPKYSLESITPAQFKTYSVIQTSLQLNSIRPSHPYHPHRSVIMRTDPAHKLRNRRAHGFNDFFRLAFVIVSDGVGKAFQSELLAGVVTHFNHAVGIEHQHVAGAQFQR